MPAPEKLVSFRRAPGVDRRALGHFAQQLRSGMAAGRSFHCLITDDRELRRLNSDFLGKECPTDVLSFPDSDEPDRQSLGEVAISVDRARDQAIEHGHSVEEEICILMLHGVLHLTGLDHERDHGRMARTERRWRKALGLPGGLIERTQT